MTVQRDSLPPIGVADIPEGKARTQVAALCWRVAEGKPQVLLVTSRETGRWVLPKGWPMAGKSAPESARTEAWEEAGVEGKVSDRCVGLYAYHKVLGPEKGVPCVVAVYPLKVKALADDFPERAERKRRWFSPKKAAQKVDEPELRELLQGFDPKSLKP
jgi:8-oxo-dGTP pyrophosphatase MutT (NUDIX family)